MTRACSGASRKPSISEALGSLHLGPVVARYLEDNPRVGVEVLMDDGYADLLTAGIDVAIRIQDR